MLVKWILYKPPFQASSVWPPKSLRDRLVAHGRKRLCTTVVHKTWTLPTKRSMVLRLISVLDQLVNKFQYKCRNLAIGQWMSHTSKVANTTYKSIYLHKGFSNESHKLIEITAATGAICRQFPKPFDGGCQTLDNDRHKRQRFIHNWQPRHLKKNKTESLHYMRTPAFYS